MQAKKDVNKQLGIVKPKAKEGQWRRIQDIVSDLSTPVADHHIKHRKQGGANLSYIEWHTACNYLDEIAPGWGWEIVTIADYSGITVVHGALSIPTADGVVARHATGIEDTDNKGYGDPVSNASAMAFKRAAALFGLGRHLYQKPEAPKPQASAKPVAQSKPASLDRLDVEINDLSKDLLKAGMSKGELHTLFTEVTLKSKREQCTIDDKAAFIRACKEELIRLSEVDVDEVFTEEAK